jgi:signal transduction histidine kinase
MPQPQDFVWTWNIFLTLILTAVVLPAVAAMMVSSIKKHLNRRDEEQDKKDKRIEELLITREKEKEAHVLEWKDSVTAKLCEIRAKLDSINESVHDKVDWGYCKNKMEKHDDRYHQVRGV